MSEREGRAPCVGDEHDEWCPANGCRCGNCACWTEVQNTLIPPTDPNEAQPWTDDERALAEVMCRELHHREFSSKWAFPCFMDLDRARAALASPWLAAHVAAQKAEAWDECAQEAFDLGWMHIDGWRDVFARNPHDSDRADRIERERDGEGT